MQDNVVEETMTVDAKHHRYFVAKRGEILRNIGEEFGGVVVSFPRPGVTSDKVKQCIFSCIYLIISTKIC